MRRLGQHFLSDPKILERIVDALEPKRSDVVLEIGPGRGSLTRALLARGVKVIAVERDRELAAALDAHENLTVISGDALTLDWHQYDATKVIGNIRKFVTACFSRRRKQLRNVMAGVTGLPVARVADDLRALGLDPAARPEILPPHAFVRLLRWSLQL